MYTFLRGLLTALSRFRGGAVHLTPARYERRVKAVNALDGDIRTLPDEELKRRAAILRQRVRNGAAPDDVLVDAFAVVRETARRTVGLRPYDVQVLAALALHDRQLVEMQTGEGKTLAAVLPACLRAMGGRGVHVLTFNDYLAARDAEWMGPIYRFLGLTVGHVGQGMASPVRRAAYECDVTYVTAREAGFDFLRDQVCFEPGQQVHRGFPFAIVDEADSILVDEARVPLVIAGPTDEDPENLGRLAAVVRTLRPGADYETGRGGRNVSFSAAGLDRVQRALRCGPLHTEANADLFTRLNLALQAEVLLHRDVDYLVRDGAIVLVDELTGRVAENRRWPYGLQAALEAKEGVPVRPQGRVLNSITLQHFLEQYEGLSGMTGTAQEAAEELQEFYGLRVVVVPPHRPCVRKDHADRVFRTKEAKVDALVREITGAHRNGRPVLVGTASVEESEHLAAHLAASGCPCRVLNARNDHEEAAVIAEAGAVGAVTISTNMAGRGTDIRLGGRDERDRDRVAALGGLLVLGTNRHESRRIDNQLRGRAGRQGDPGETRFLVSVEDDLIHRHGIGELVAGPAESAPGAVLDDPRVGGAIEHVQRVIEGESFEIRRTLRKFSFCLERQRRLVQERRQRLLTGADAPTLLRERDPELHDRLVNERGEEAVRLTERHLTLAHMDRCWSEHLAHVAEVREGIHLISMGGFNAFDEFNGQINEAYRDFTRRVDEEVLASLRAGGGGEADGVLGPSSTWTYMINDNPMGDILARLMRGLKRLVGRPS